jgi:hypothetical protein
VGALAVSMMGWSLVRMPGDIEPKESKGGDQAGSQHILNEGRAWVLALFAVGLGTEARHVAVSNSPMHRSTTFKRRRTSRLELAKVDSRGANHKRALGVARGCTSAWRAYRSAHTTLARWHLVVYRGRTRGQSKKWSPSEELEEEQQESDPRVLAGRRGW